MGEIRLRARRFEDSSTLAPHDAIPSQEHRVTTRHTEADARIAIDDRLRQAGWDPIDKSMVGTEIQATDSASTGSVVDRSRARPFETHAPVYDLEAAPVPSAPTGWWVRSATRSGGRRCRNPFVSRAIISSRASADDRWSPRSLTAPTACSEPTAAAAARENLCSCGSAAPPIQHSGVSSRSRSTRAQREPPRTATGAIARFGSSR